MTFIHAIILGIVEGITEFLPISSTGHLIVTSKLIGLVDSEFLRSFEIFIQLGAILAVVYYYRRTIATSVATWKRVLAAFIPTGVIGFLLYTLVKQYLLGNAMIVVWSLIIGGVILIVFERWCQRKTATGYVATFNTVSEVPFKIAVYIGISQALAVIPGVSRSGTTIVAGQSLGLSRAAVVEFSFLLAIPTMLAASGLDLLKSGITFSGEQWLLLGIGFVTAFVVALMVIKWLLTYIQKHSFIVFGIYRIIAGLIFFFVLF